MAKKQKGLPITTYTVLGLLSFGEELSGYDIRQWAQNMRFFYWSPAQSQVYTELQRLEERGYVLSHLVEQRGKPNKRLYRITDRGIEEFKRWMKSDEAESTTVLKHGVALRLFFGHMTTPDVLIELLERFVEDAHEQMGQLGIVQEYMENTPTLDYPALVAEWGYHYLKAEVSMAQKLIERLKNSPAQTVPEK
ncbi:MAG: helix-turn-helix transcriptional regulator [Chloroflexota bacterium]